MLARSGEAGSYLSKTLNFLRRFVEYDFPHWQSIHRISDTLILLQCDHADLQTSSPKVVRLMADRDARAAYDRIPSQLPNEILRPGGTR